MSSGLIGGYFDDPEASVDGDGNSCFIPCVNAIGTPDTQPATELADTSPERGKDLGRHRLQDRLGAREDSVPARPGRHDVGEAEFAGASDEVSVALHR